MRFFGELVEGNGVAGSLDVACFVGREGGEEELGAG